MLSPWDCYHCLRAARCHPWACGTLQTPALNSHQKDNFPPPGALCGTAQELLLCLEHPLQAAAGHVLSRSWWFRSRKSLPHLNFCSTMTVKSEGAEGGNKNLHREQFEEPDIVHRAGSHLVGQQLQRLSAIFPNGMSSTLAQEQSMRGTSDGVTSCLSVGDICRAPMGLSTRLPKLWPTHR